MKPKEFFHKLGKLGRVYWVTGDSPALMYDPDNLVHVAKYDIMRRRLVWFPYVPKEQWHDRVFKDAEEAQHYVQHNYYTWKPLPGAQAESVKDFINQLAVVRDNQAVLSKSGLIWRKRRDGKVSVTNPSTGHKRVFDMSDVKLDPDQFDSRREFERYYRGAVAAWGWYDEGRAKSFILGLPKPGNWVAVAFGHSHVWLENKDRPERRICVSMISSRVPFYEVGYYSNKGVTLLDNDEFTLSASDMNAAVQKAKHMADAFFRHYEATRQM